MEFLLTNLPYYYSYPEEDVLAYRKQYEYHGMGVGGSAKAARDSVMKEYGLINAITSNPIPDLESVTPEYLIDNIEWAFKVRKEQPWGSIFLRAFEQGAQQLFLCFSPIPAPYYVIF